MVEWLEVEKIFASGLAYLMSAVYNYILNYRITFGSQQSHWRTAPKFGLVVLIGVAVNTAVFAFFLLMLPYFAAQVFAIGATLITNYLLHKFWIYRGI
jgi:putative flippase GtrA